MSLIWSPIQIKNERNVFICQVISHSAENIKKTAMETTTEVNHFQCTNKCEQPNPNSYCIQFEIAFSWADKERFVL